MLTLVRRAGLLMAAALLFTVPAFSQNCALCYTQAASSGKRFIAGLRTGIIVLIVPPMFMSAGITLLAYRKRNQFRTEHSGSIENEPGDLD